MITFVATNRISSLNIGDRLKSRRKEFGLDLDDISDSTSISKKNLEHLEANEFERIPEGFYRGLFLKNYAAYLGLEWRELESEYKKQTLLYHPAIEDGGSPSSISTIQTSQLWVTSRILKNILVGGGIAACFIYLSFLAFTIVRPPHLDILSPGDNSSTLQGRITIEGITRDDARIRINGQDVMKDGKGSFKQDVVLSEGINTIRVTAEKKYSQTAEVTRRVFYRKDTAQQKKQDIHF